MAQKRSSGESRRDSSSSRQPGESKQMGQRESKQGSKQMGQSGEGRQQGTLHAPRQGGSGTTSTKRQQTAQDVQRTDEAELHRHGANRRDEAIEADEDIERAGLTRESGIDDEEKSR